MELNYRKIGEDLIVPEELKSEIRKNWELLLNSSGDPI
jgi:hypothetical protein